MEHADARILLSQQVIVPLGELVEELIAAVGDKACEVGTVRQLEGQDRRGMVGAQALQLGHRQTLPIWGLAAPRVFGREACCEIAIGVAMGYMLIMMV